LVKSGFCGIIQSRRISVFIRRLNGEVIGSYLCIRVEFPFRAIRSVAVSVVSVVIKSEPSKRRSGAVFNIGGSAFYFLTGNPAWRRRHVRR